MRRDLQAQPCGRATPAVSGSKIASCLILALLLSPEIRAQTAGNRVAVVNGQKVLLECREGKKALEQLKSKFDGKKRDFESRQNEITQLQSQVDRGGALITDEKKAELSESIGEKKKRLQRDLQDADEDFQRDQQQVFQPISGRVDALISKYAADSGYSLVLDYSVAGSAVRYAATGTDITDQLIAQYDKTYGDGAAPGAKR